VRAPAKPCLLRQRPGVARTVGAAAVGTTEQRRARRDKVAKVSREGSKVATRVPSTGVKRAKGANLMVMGDTCDSNDTLDTL
jgi:hypothetical protein